MSYKYRKTINRAIYSFFGKIIDKIIEEQKAKMITLNDTREDICKENIPKSILRPINNKITAKPFCK